MVTAALQAAAAAFALAFELVAAAIGRAAALLDSRVQAARRFYLTERGKAWAG